MSELTGTPMPIWDEQAYFAVPTETDFILTASAQQVAPGDPMRVAIIFGLNLGNAAVTTTPICAISVNPSFTDKQGIIISQQSPVISLTYRDYGPLVQQTWFALDPSGAAQPRNLSVTVVRYLRWPGQTGRRGILEQIDANAANAANQQANRNRLQRRLADINRGQSAPGEANNIPSLIESCKRGFIPACDRHLWLAPSNWRVPTGTR